MSRCPLKLHAVIFGDFPEIAEFRVCDTGIDSQCNDKLSAMPRVLGIRV